jgi:hypothetical protein
MAGFDVSSVEELDYDFTGITRDDGKGKCSGKGVVPEPSTKRLQEFQKAVLEFTRSRLPEEADNASGNTGQSIDAEIREGLMEAMQQVERDGEDREETSKILEKLTQKSPSKEEMDELPPRYFTRFFQYVYQGVAPEASSAATPV